MCQFDSMINVLDGRFFTGSIEGRQHPLPTEWFWWQRPIKRPNPSFEFHCFPRPTATVLRPGWSTKVRSSAPQLLTFATELSETLVYGPVIRYHNYRFQNYWNDHDHDLKKKYIYIYLLYNISLWSRKTPLVYLWQHAQDRAWTYGCTQRSSNTGHEGGIVFVYAIYTLFNLYKNCCRNWHRQQILQ